MNNLSEASPDAVVRASSNVRHFVRQVEGAAAFLAAAHVGGGTRIPALSKPARPPSGVARSSWYTFVVKSTVTRLHDIMGVFAKHPAEGAGIAAELEAFKMLTELTPAGPQLLILASRDRRLAFSELAKYMNFVRQEFELTAALEERLAATGTGRDDRSCRGGRRW